ncbi:MMPL family transporter [Streptomyces sp. P9(2023)]|uniref:MMPL family transporter n=1 Tax=Streptomyces sp. P9(2023) TaxID=3064394 RepID=UPI0028F3F5E5|nr:MMPL family transporter [Streptomyces sp. P9(2023)]MDT9692098.1 MMPL family transporter [Streptomyces sp. P9(2023)]
MLVLAVLGFAIAGAIASPAMKVLSTGGFEDPNSESAIAVDVLRDRFDTGDPNFVLLARAPQNVDTNEAAAAGRALTEKLTGQDGVAEVTSYWTSGLPADLRSKDGRSALVMARLSGDEDDALKTARRIAPLVTGEQGVLEVKSGGRAEFNRQGSERVTSDLTRAEGIALPITVLLLVLVFGSGIAALLPLAVAGVSVVGSLAVLRLLNEVTGVSIFAINLATALGLGLAIDYSLFIVSRYREELRKGHDTGAALRASLRTAGRTVLFSALTVLLSLSALLVFPLYFLRSFAYAGIAVVFFATLGAVVLLPALLAVIGPRIDKFDVLARLRRRGRQEPERAEDSKWHRLATSVMKRPWPVLTVVLIALAVAVLPFSKASFGLPDDRALPKDLAAAQVGAATRAEFPSLAGQDLKVVLTGKKPDEAALTQYARALSQVSGVKRVDTASGSFLDGGQVAASAAGAEKVFTDADGAWLSLGTGIEAYSQAGEDLTADVRTVPAPEGTKALVAGRAATYTDTLDSLWSALPYALGIIAVTTFVLLFLFTGSVLMPFKAIVLNLLSLTVTYGAMVFVFQDGNLQWLVGDFTVTGQIDVTMPILMFCIIFGLSMDYEVFLLSRIKEEYDRTGDNQKAVAIGLQSTGGLITAAAGLLALFFTALVSAGVTHVKMLGLGTALAIAMDALVIRALLVPAFMQLAGRANWWAPAPLRRLHERIGLSHAPDTDEPLPAQAGGGKVGGPSPQAVR